jgi:flagellar basal-body rod protein FlgB
MKIGFSSDATVEAMGSYLSRLSRRQQVVASNLANIDTPGYRTNDVSFHATLGELIEETAIPDSRGASMPRFRPVQPDVFEVEGLHVKPDGNNVDLDREMLKLGETAFGYSMMSQLLRSKFRVLASAINEGRGGV